MIFLQPSVNHSSFTNRTVFSSVPNKTIVKSNINNIHEWINQYFFLDIDMYILYYAMPISQHIQGTVFVCGEYHDTKIRQIQIIFHSKATFFKRKLSVNCEESTFLFWVRLCWVKATNMKYNLTFLLKTPVVETGFMGWNKISRTMILYS